MGVALAYERVRRDVDVLARAGLDSATFLAEVYLSMQRALPSDAACVATLDPATHLATGAFKFGDLEDRHDTDELWGYLEYGHVESTSFTELCRSGVTSIGMSAATNGCPTQSRRFEELVAAALGCTDELRVIASDRGDLWGGVALFRQDRATPYSDEAVAFAASLSSALARGLRVGVLAAVAGDARTTSRAAGPGVMIFDSGGQLAEATPGAVDRMTQRLASGVPVSSVVVGALVAAAWRYASGASTALPSARIRLASGEWIVLHAAPLTTASGSTTSVVMTVDDARPPDVVPLVAAAFDLTIRERDVALLILQGADTRAIASTLHLSVHTVQDHVKSIFNKTGVRSRRELLANVFFEQYVPRMGGELSPSGSFRL